MPIVDDLEVVQVQKQQREGSFRTARPLDLFPVSLRDGDLVVDTSRPIEREAFDSSQVFYLG